MRKRFITLTDISSAVPDMPDPIAFTGLIFNINGKQIPACLDSGVPNAKIETSLARSMGIKTGDIVSITLDGVGTVNVPVKLWYFTSIPPKFFLDRCDIIFTPYEAIFTPRIHEPLCPFIRTGQNKMKTPLADYDGFIHFAIGNKIFPGLLDTGEYAPVIDQDGAKITGIEKYPKRNMVYWEDSGFLQGYLAPLKIVGGPRMDTVIYVSNPGSEDMPMSIMAAEQIIDRGYHIIFTKDGVSFKWSGEVVRNRRIHS